MTEQQQGTDLVKAQESADKFQERLLSLAKTPEERQAAFSAMSAYRQSQIVRAAAAGLSALSWGKDLNDQARFWVTRYAYETGTDPLRHWEILGNRLYDTAELWLDFATSREDFDGYEHEHVNDDERASAEERQRRTDLRVKHNIPDDVAGACVVTIWRRGIGKPFIGVNYAGNRKCYIPSRKEEGVKLDPIGESDPGKTAFTRAFRRAARTAWGIWFSGHPTPGDGGIDVTDVRAKAEDMIAVDHENRHLPDPSVASAVEVQEGLSVRAGGAPNAPVRDLEDPYAD